MQRLMRFKNVNLGWKVKSNIAELSGKSSKMAIHDFFVATGLEHAMRSMFRSQFIYIFFLPDGLFITSSYYF